MKDYLLLLHNVVSIKVVLHDQTLGKDFLKLCSENIFMPSRFSKAVNTPAPFTFLKSELVNSTPQEGLLSFKIALFTLISFAIFKAS